MNVERLAAVQSILRSIAVGDRDVHAARFAKVILLSAAIGRINGSPVATSTANPRAEIQRLVVLADKLRDHILSMHRNARDAVTPKIGDADCPQGPHPLELAEDLFAMMQVAEKAYCDLPEWIELPKKKVVRKPDARAVTVAALRAYEALTGERRKITATDEGDGGPFVEFLNQIFSALEISASAAAQVRER